MAETFTKANFQSEVINASTPVLVDFWADWCGPCRMVSPIIEELAEEFSGKVKIGKINVDTDGDLASNYAVVSIPTVMLFADGKIAERLVGANPKEAYIQMIEKHI